MNIKELALISVSGEQAREFLQGQISTDMREVSATEARLATLCNLKGRMLASFLVVEMAEMQFGLVVHQSVAAACVAELQKFAIFSRCDIAPSEQLILAAAAKPNAERHLWQVEQQKGGGEEPASLTVQLPNDVDLVIGNLPNARVGMDHAEFWASMIHAKIAWVTDETSEAYLPQVFFDDERDLKAVSYSKGCYKGQEVVARMHFRGELKEGLYAITQQDVLPIGHEFRDSEGKLIGKVVYSAAPKDQSVTQSATELLAVLRHDKAALLV